MLQHADVFGILRRCSGFWDAFIANIFMRQTTPAYHASAAGASPTKPKITKAIIHHITPPPASRSFRRQMPAMSRLAFGDPAGFGLDMGHGADNGLWAAGVCLRYRVLSFCVYCSVNLLHITASHAYASASAYSKNCTVSRSLCFARARWRSHRESASY